MDPSPLGEVLALGGREDFPDLPGVLYHNSHSSDVQAVSGGRHGRSENSASSLTVGLAFCSPLLRSFVSWRSMNSMSSCRAHDSPE
eukprot:16432634-Heterocapsa_arctica.AAC.1